MAEMIPIVEQTGPASWSNDYTISGHVDTLKFRVVGGTFGDDSTEKDIAPSSGSSYTVALKATVTVDASATQPVLLYYLDGDSWILVHPASRIFVRPQVKELDYRLVTKGMDALPLGATLNPTYNGMIIGGGVRIPTTQALQQSIVAKISDLDSSFFDLTKPVSFVHDRAAQTLYYLHTDGSVNNTQIFGALNADIAGYKVSYDSTGKRSAVVFHTSGQVDVLDEAMSSGAIPIQLGYEINRVVCRRAGVGTNTVDSYVVFDKSGRAHYLNAAFAETSVKSDQFYVNASDSYDVLTTLDGKLVGGNTASAPANVFWYQFVPSSLLVLGHDGTNIYQFNIRDNVQNVAARPLVANDLVVFNTTAAWTNDGGKLVAGMDTNGSDALFGFADAENPTQTRNGWSYLNLITPPYKQEDTYDRLFYYAARPASNLKHLTIRNYQTTWPDLSSVALGPTVTFTVTVDAGDPDIALPITAPAGVTVTAKVAGQPVTKVYDGQTVTVTLSHPYITSASFPVSIGRTVYQFEMKADDMPDAFAWQNILGIENDTWNRTEDVTISGINVSVPVSVLIDGQEDYSRVKIYVDGTETAMPVYLRNNQKLGFEILHENDTSRVTVNVGKGASTFGLYTVVEAHLDVGRHWAYVPLGKQVQSDVMKNTGTIPLTLTITDTDAQFFSGGQTITLPVGASTSIVFTPQENKQYTIKFSSAQYEYEWYVWADKTWLGAVPATKRGERYVMDNSGTFFIDNIPDNFWTYFTIPAGMLLDIDGVRVEQDLDSRGVYKEQGLTVGPFECADTMLKIYGLPSHQQPHTLMFGNAPLGWLYDMTTDPTYTAYWYDKILPIDLSYVNRVAESVTTLPVTTFIGTGRDVVIVTPKYDPELDVQPQWFNFLDARTHALTAAPITFIEAETAEPQVIAGPQFIVGQKDFVDNFRMADLIARSEIKVDLFDLFELTQGTETVPQPIPLFTFIGTDRGNAVTDFPLFEPTLGEQAAHESFPLFELTQGVEAVHQLFPLFEMFVGNTITSDDFWPDFESVSTIVSDTFINTFVEHMDLPPEYFDIAEPKYRQRLDSYAGPTLPQFVDTTGSYPVAGAEINKVTDGGRYPNVGAEGKYVQTSGTYPQQMNEGQYVPASVIYHIEWARPLWRPAVVTYHATTLTGRYVDPIYHPIVLFLPEIPFVRWNKPADYYHYVPPTPTRMEHLVKYPVNPAPGEFQQHKLVAAPVDVAVPEFTVSSPTYLHEMTSEFTKNSPALKGKMLAGDHVKTPRVIVASASKGKQATRPSIKVEIRAGRKAENKVYGLDRPVIETWLAPPNHGSINKPLEEGYFESELLALQNATQVWGFDPSVVFAIQQPNGAWTWAQVTVCEESCGSMSCAARGYLSGG